MREDELELLIIGYLDGSLDEDDRNRAEALLSDDPRAKKIHAELLSLFASIDRSPAPVPSAKLADRFYQTLNDERSASATRNKFGAWWLPVAAAAALFITGTAIGYWIRLNDGALSTDKDTARSATERMLEQLEDMTSASRRIEAVLTGTETAPPDMDMFNALEKVMNEDPNSNVRLAALDALVRFRDEAPVREALIRSLGSQTDPVIQLELIRLMVEMKESTSVGMLRKLADDNDVLPAVRDEAHAGLIRLI